MSCLQSFFRKEKQLPGGVVLYIMIDFSIFAIKFICLMSTLKRFCLLLLFTTVLVVCPGAKETDDLTDSLSKLSAESLFKAGIDAFGSSDFDKSIRIFSMMCPLYDENGDKDSQLLFAACFNHYGNLLYKRGAYASAMEYYLKARKIAEQFDDEDLLGDVLANIGNIYAASEDYESAIDFFRKGLYHSRNSSDYPLRTMLVNNLFAANYLNGNLDSAKYYCSMYEKLPVEQRNRRYRYDVYLNKGMLSESAGKYNAATFYYKKAAEYSKAVKLPILCEEAAYSCLAKHYDNVGKLDSALFYLHEAEAVARKVQSQRPLVEVLRQLATVYDKKRNIEKALEYKTEYLDLADSISIQEEFIRLKNSQMLYEMDQNASTIKGLNAEKTYQRQWLLVLSGAIIIFCLLVAALIYQKNKLKKVCADLYERNDRQLTEEIRYKSRIKQLEETLTTLEQAEQNESEDVSETNTPDSSSQDTNDDSASSEEAAGRKFMSNEMLRKRILKDILNVMENTEDFCATDFSLERLAASINSNARYVSEVINDEFHKNFRSMLNEYRIKKAMLRLSDIPNYGNLTIKAIAESVGYKSQGTFISVFTKFTGLKPSLYQKLALEKERNEEH